MCPTRQKMSGHSCSGTESPILLDPNCSSMSSGLVLLDSCPLGVEGTQWGIGTSVINDDTERVEGISDLIHLYRIVEHGSYIEPSVEYSTSPYYGMADQGWPLSPHWGSYLERVPLRRTSPLFHKKNRPLMQRLMDTHRRRNDSWRRTRVHVKPNK